MKLQALQVSIYQQSCQWSFSKICKRALTISMVALAVIIAQSSRSFEQNDRAGIADCFSSNCPDIDQSHNRRCIQERKLPLR